MGSFSVTLYRNLVRKRKEECKGKGRQRRKDEKFTKFSKRFKKGIGELLLVIFPRKLMKMRVFFFFQENAVLGERERERLVVSFLKKRGPLKYSSRGVLILMLLLLDFFR